MLEAEDKKITVFFPVDFWIFDKVYYFKSKCGNNPSNV